MKSPTRRSKARFRLSAGASIALLVLVAWWSATAAAQESLPLPHLVVVRDAFEAPQPLACPTGNIPNFAARLARCGDLKTYSLSWGSPSGATGNTVYEILQHSPYTSYCAVPSSLPLSSFSVIATTSSTSYTYVDGTLDEIRPVVVRVQGCSSVFSSFSPVDTFSSAPAPPVLAAMASGSSEVTTSYQQPDGKAFFVRSLERSFNGGGFAPVSGFPVTLQDYCPAGSTHTYVDSGLPAGSYSYRISNSGNATTCFDSVMSNVVTVVVGSTCATPGAPSFTNLPQSAPSGKPIAVSWSAAANLAAGGTYVLEVSHDGFLTVDSTLTTTATSVVIPTTASGSDSTLSLRVHAVQPCGTAGASSVASIFLTAAQASFVITQAGPSWTAVKGGAPPTAIVTFRNVGGVAGRLVFQSAGGFFSFSPSFLDVGPGADGSVTLTARAEALQRSGLYSGRLQATAGASVLSTGVTLTVADRAASPGTKARASVAEVLFRAAPGQTPVPQTITITVSPNPGSVMLAPSIGPDGQWLSLSGELAFPVPASGEVHLTLSVDRTMRSQKEAGPIYRTALRLVPVGADPTDDAASVEVLDVDTFSVVGAAGQRGGGIGVKPPGGSSFVLPTAVKATSGVNAGQVFTTDGFLRNVSGSPVPVDIFCAADGMDGNVQVVKTSATLQPGGTLRTSDLMDTLFSANGVSANIEVRAATPSALSFRSTTDSVTGGDPASHFGTEIPVVAFGIGAALGGPELVVAGIDDDAQNRANLILAETSGAPASVVVTVYDSNGNVVGATQSPINVLPFSKTQVNRVVRALVSPTATLSGGSVGVGVVSGNGRVAAVATIIDNNSGSFSAVIGRLPRELLMASRAGSVPLAAGSDRYLLPAVARTLGAFNTQFLTNMSVVNGTASTANLNLTYNYIDQDDGGKVKSVTKALSIRPRGSLAKSTGSDVISKLFGVTGRSFGSIQMSGDIARIVAVAAVSAQVDPNDPSKGVKSAQVNGMPLDAPAVAAASEPERRFAGIEKSPQKRTNLVLLEVDGQPCTVLVRLNTQSGETMALATFTLAANEYRQITDVFGPDGGKLGGGPYQNVEVTAQVLSGTGRVLGLASVIDNVSRNPEIFVLTLPGPPPDPSIGF